MSGHCQNYKSIVSRSANGSSPKSQSSRFLKPQLSVPRSPHVHLGRSDPDFQDSAAV
jgi:hypothetical protein